MKGVVIYVKSTCGYCRKAKALLDRKGVPYEEIDILRHPERQDEMIGRADGRTTVPQVFVNGQALGGSDDLAALDRAGKLDTLLAA